MKTLLSEDEIREGITRVAHSVTEVYGTQPVTIVGVLTGSLVFMADLIRQLEMPLRLGFLSASSYRGQMSRGSLVVNSDLMPSVGNTHVLLVDDIFDTGHTLMKLDQVMREHESKSVRSAVLLRKIGRQEVPYGPDFVAFDIPDEFVVGYGMDYQDMFRNLPHVAAVQPEDIARFVG
ncbi:MAG TPA: hypoxanthine phosphoribosyltransferase [Pirellulaceae bacterium]